jgi:hypothetical protein
MKILRINGLLPQAPLWVWDGTWLPAHLVEASLDSAAGRVLVRFSHGVSAPIEVSRVVPRDPALHGSDRPSADLSTMMYAESLRGPLSLSCPQPARPIQSVTRSSTNLYGFLRRSGRFQRTKSRSSL